MPIYEYKCSVCSHVFENIVNNTHPTFKECPKCGGRGDRKVSAHASTASNWKVAE